MARISFKGLQQYELQLSKLRDGTREIAEKAVFEGANIIADEVKKNLNSINSTSQMLAIKAFANQTPTYITEEAKKGLIESFGITPLRDDDGYYNVKVGFDGYNSVVTKKYPKGQPNNMIARSCESGSSSMIKQPFMRTAVNAKKKEAEQKMAEIISAEIEKKMEG